MRYTESHEWAKVEEGIAICGISHFAQKELGEIVFVELPRVGDHLKMGGEAAVLESTKSACDIYSPLSGEVIEVNTDLKDAPEMINHSPSDKGWIYKIKLTQPIELQKLMTEDAYQRFLS